MGCWPQTLAWIHAAVSEKSEMTDGQTVSCATTVALVLKQAELKFGILNNWSKSKFKTPTTLYGDDHHKPVKSLVAKRSQLHRRSSVSKCSRKQKKILQIHNLLNQQKINMVDSYLSTTFGIDRC